MPTSLLLLLPKITSLLCYLPQTWVCSIPDNCYMKWTPMSSILFQINAAANCLLNRCKICIIIKYVETLQLTVFSLLHCRINSNAALMVSWLTQDIFNKSFVKFQNLFQKWRRKNVFSCLTYSSLFNEFTINVEILSQFVKIPLLWNCFLYFNVEQTDRTQLYNNR